METGSVERNVSNALDILNCAAREVSIRLGTVLSVVRGPRPEKQPEAKPTAGGLFTDLEHIAHNLQQANDQISELERAIGHGVKVGGPGINTPPQTIIQSGPGRY